MSNKAVLVYTTFSNESSAKEIAKKAVLDKIVACVNIIPAISSIYFWGGKVNEESEVIALFKTTKERYRGVMDWIHLRHPYQSSAVLAVNAETTASFFKFLSNI